VTDVGEGPSLRPGPNSPAITGKPPDAPAAARACSPPTKGTADPV